MRRKPLGRSGPKMSEFCLGARAFGETWRWGGSALECRAMFDSFAGADPGGVLADP